MSELKNKLCPFCSENKCILREEEIEIPFFGRTFVFSMECEGCGAKNSDVEPAEKKEAMRYTFDVSSEEDLSVRIVKSGEATVKIPHVITMEPGPASQGYVTNVEGLIEKVKKTIEASTEGEDDEAARKKGKNLVKKLNNVLLGRETLRIIIEDKTGHSAIISDKAEKVKI